MNKKELINDLKSRVIRIIKEPLAPQIVNGGDKSYLYHCLIEEDNNVAREQEFNIRVVDEGLKSERAYYYLSQPPKSQSDLDIGLALAYSKYGNFNYVAELKNGYKIQKPDGSLVVLKLTPDKTDLIEVGAI